MSSAFWRTNSRSWRSWPTSIASAMTSRSCSRRATGSPRRCRGRPSTRARHFSRATCLVPLRAVRTAAVNRARRCRGLRATPRNLFSCRRAASASLAPLVMTRIVSSPAIEPRMPSSSAASSAAATPGAVPATALTMHELVGALHVGDEFGDHALQVQVLGEHVDALGELRSPISVMSRETVACVQTKPCCLQPVDECALGPHALGAHDAPDRFLRSSRFLMVRSCRRRSLAAVRTWGR